MHVSGNDRGAKVSKLRAGLFCETDLFKEVAESCLQVLLEDSRILNSLPRFFGEMGCFGRGRHYFSAESVEDSQVRLISGNTIQAMMECSPSLAHAVIGLISERFDRFLCEFEADALKGTIPRLAALLLKKREEDIVCGLTYKDLAGELS